MIFIICRVLAQVLVQPATIYQGSLEVLVMMGRRKYSLLTRLEGGLEHLVRLIGWIREFAV